jgi:LAS superfamily LD-carboxypeptidase LdcB
MDSRTLKRILFYILPAIIVFITLGGVLIYQSRQITMLKNDVSMLTRNLASTTHAVLATMSNTNQLSKNVTDLSSKTSDISSTLTSAQQNIDAVKSQVGGVEQTVGSISGTVGTLQKLVSADPEILKKYSKIYFTNENYVPAHLTFIPQEYVYSSTKQERYLSEAYPYLKSMLDQAKANGTPLYVKSAYRSFSEQKSLKTTYSVVYGAGTANSFSADQGYSEHQLGTAVDVISTGLGGTLTTNFDKTSAYKWLHENAFRYGFVLSYPKGNSYYVYEPWHWRFIGVKLATYLHDTNKNFYDLDQREIDTYLATTFD